MLEVEMNIKRHSSQQWSPKLREAVQLFHYQKTRLTKQLSGRKVHHQVEEKLEESVARQEKFQGKLKKIIRQQLRRALKELRKVNKSDRENLRAFLTELIQERLQAEARPVRAILHTERIIKIHRRFNKMIYKSRKGISKLSTQEDHSEIIFEDRLEVESALHNHNIQPFQQPKQRRTPFSTPPLLHHLVFGSTSQEASDFAQNPNHKLPEDIHPLAEEILEELHPQHNGPSSTDFTVTAGDLQEAFSKWKEKNYRPKGHRPMQLQSMV